MTIAEAWKLWFPYTKLGRIITEVKAGNSWSLAWDKVFYPQLESLAVVMDNYSRQLKNLEREIKEVEKRQDLHRRLQEEHRNLFGYTHIIAHEERWEMKSRS